MRDSYCLVDSNSIWSIGSIAKPFLYLFEDKVHSQISLFNRHISSENNWQPALGMGHYSSSERDLISWSVTNQWLPTIPIILPSTFVSTEDKHCRFYSFLLLIFPSTNSYCITHINKNFNQLYKHRDIYPILYVNQHGK